MRCPSVALSLCLSASLPLCRSASLPLCPSASLSLARILCPMFNSVWTLQYMLQCYSTSDLIPLRGMHQLIAALSPSCKGCGSAAVKEKKGTCYYRCYDKTVGGDPYKQTKPIPQQTLTSTWEKAFESEDPNSGGCPREPIEYDQ